MNDIDERRVYIPAAIGHEPTTPAEALLSAAALLEEEGRWLQHAFFRNAADSTDEYVDNPFCNGWGTCAVGALQCVTLGVRRVETVDYSKPFDNVTGTFPTCYRWTTDEDYYQGYVDGWYGDDDFAKLSDNERRYVEAHTFLDHEACALSSVDSAIGLNDSDNTTREMVVDMFRGAAKRAEAAANG